ncbi:MAG: hypothetical protein LC749_15075, partial [Actinobacteria bacterium]|nr:hypothetical protein [Actinomycetota bacterium]
MSTEAGGSGTPNCAFASAASIPKGLAFMIVSGHIVRIDVHTSPGGSSPISTISGIHIGSTEADVKHAY